MTGPRRFDPSELGTDSPDEIDAARIAAAWLEAAIDAPPVAPSAAFHDRVMTAVANEPAPSAVGFMAPVQHRGFLAGFASSVRQAWASVGEGGRPPLARASALAYVLAIVIAGTSLAGVATVGLAGALGILGPTTSQSAAPPSPGPITSPERSTPPDAESPEPSADETAEPSESPDASDDHGGGGVEPSDDHGGGGPRSSDDHGSGGPKASDDHGGGDAEPSGDHGGDTAEPTDAPESSPGSSD